MNKIYLRGDTHGNFNFLPEFCRKNKTDLSDVLIILGDAGLNFYGEKKVRENFIKQIVSDYKITVFCIRGNHEARPQTYKTMNLIKHHIIKGDEVWQQEDYPNILYAQDGGEYNIYGKSFLTVGGAYSVDKFYRLMNNLTWFQDEQLTQEEMNLIEQKTKDKCYDYVLTHTCPFSWQPTWLFMKGVDQSSVDNTMERWFELIKNNFSYKKWFFGHFHGEWDYKEKNGIPAAMLYNNIIELV